MIENRAEKLKEVKVNYDRDSLIKLIGFDNSRIVDKLSYNTPILNLSLLVDFSKCDINNKSIELDIDDENNSTMWVINNTILVNVEFFISENILENFFIFKKPLNITNHIKNLDCTLNAEIIGKNSNKHKNRLIEELESKINEIVVRYFLSGDIQFTLEFD